ncbi:hypothetical protein [Polaromonas hydrogenivorans]|uniref:Uncharacterized protein n=1 Tax=Polaromonas hydrogenivorans TaxID=335476 RepID=A0AAU7LXL1_9BURK
MGISALVRGLATFAGDCPLTLRIHGRKTAFGFAFLIAATFAATFGALSVRSHFSLSPSGRTR